MGRWLRGCGAVSDRSAFVSAAVGSAVTVGDRAATERRPEFSRILLRIPQSPNTHTLPANSGEPMMAASTC